MLDMLCLTGEVGWGAAVAARARRSGRPLPPSGDAGRAVPARARRRRGRRCAAAGDPDGDATRRRCSDDAAAVSSTLLRRRGASFLHGSAAATGARRPTTCSAALGELVAAGARRVGRLRRPARDARRRAAASRSRRWRVRSRRLRAGARRRRALVAGRRAATRRRGRRREDAAVELQARALLRRYGVVFRRLLTREANAASVARAGARLPPPRGARRDPRRPLRRRACRASSSRCPTRSSGCARSAAPPPTGALVTISAADPLNLAGIVTGERPRRGGRQQPDRLPRRRAARGARRRLRCGRCTTTSRSGARRCQRPHRTPRAGGGQRLRRRPLRAG